MDKMDFEKTRKRKPKDSEESVRTEPIVYGKIPPQAKDIEEAILGAIMLEKDSLDTVNEILKPECFYVEGHQRIFKAMISLSQKGQPIDILTVTEELRAKEDLEFVGGPYYITRLTNAVVNSYNIETHCRIVLQKHIQREVIRICGDLIHEAYSDGTDALELLDETELRLGEITNSVHYGDMFPIDSVIIDAVRKIEEWRNLDSSITGVPSGYKDLDQATRGWQSSDLIILSARPSVGKTAFALNLIRNAAEHFKQLRARDPEQNKSVAVFSLEMERVMLMLRMMAAESGELLYRIQTGRLSDEQMKSIYEKGIQRLVKLNIFFDDNSNLTIQRLKSRCRKLKRKNQLGIVFIDYLQLMTPRNNKQIREQQVSEISRELKLLSKELEVPIIALSQMSREIEKRTGPNRKPQLSDLRESGSLEQDADVVCFLWGPDEEEILADASLVGRRYLRIAKARNGMLITLDFNFKNEIQLFEQISSMTGLTGAWKPVQATVDFNEPEKKTIESGNNNEDLPFS